MVSGLPLQPYSICCSSRLYLTTMQSDIRCSILGPLLFILAFDGIFRLPLAPGSNLTGFADDTTYNRPISGPADEASVNNDLGIICSWLNSYRFRLNIAKAKAMVISRKKVPPRPVVKLNGETLEHVDQFRLLGVIITPDLSWATHIFSVIFKLLGFLYRTFRDGSQTTLATLYKAIVVPHLDYCSSVWDPPHTTYIRKLERVQSFTAHVVTRDWASSSSELLATMKWPSLASRRLRRKLCLCHRILSGNSMIDPSFFPTANHRCASHKNSAPLYRPFVRTLHHKHSFRWSIVDQWNKLPPPSTLFLFHVTLLSRGTFVIASG